MLILQYKGVYYSIQTSQDDRLIAFNKCAFTLIFTVLRLFCDCFDGFATVLRLMWVYFDEQADHRVQHPSLRHPELLPFRGHPLGRWICAAAGKPSPDLSIAGMFY